MFRTDSVFPSKMVGFKNIIVENGEPLVNCLAHIDLNPVDFQFLNRKSGRDIRF